jgi:CheY-like chemotaxis protein/ketosteroid isomerase-like protein
MPQLLVVEDDLDIRDALAQLLSDEGYAVTAVASQAEGLALIDAQTFALILTDLFEHTTRPPLASATLLRERAYPTPVGVLTGWRVTPEEIQAAGLAFVVTKPFDLDALLTTISVVLQTPLTPEQERHAQVVRDYFARLSERDWDGLVALCTPDVSYALPGASALSTRVRGRAAFRAYTQETFRAFPVAKFDDVRVFATPRGLAARYQVHLVLADGTALNQAGSVLFTFSAAAIRTIGIRLNDEQLRALLAENKPA